jgi:CRP-like cAMP-binding protein
MNSIPDIQQYEFRQALQNRLAEPLSNNCLKEILQQLRSETMHSGQHYSYEGDSARRLSWIYKGLFRIYYTDSEGREWNKYFASESEFLSESLSPHQKSRVSIQCLEEARILSLPLKALSQLETQHPELSQLIPGLSQDYLQQKESREISLLTLNARERYKKFIQNYPELSSRIPKFHIASHLGITPTQLSRIRAR